MSKEKGINKDIGIAKYQAGILVSDTLAARKVNDNIQQSVGSPLINEIETDNNRQAQRKLTDRFIFVYSIYKKNYMKKNKVYPLFKTFNKKTLSTCWVFDATDRARTICGSYKPYNPAESNKESGNNK